ncbi:hypothetical protein [Pseudothioclava nitratireducens]|jgi:hypothetical protein|uniref:hypothetical protein n=1 Tax=Pseudothioclava nitratireducens TaxID=1928646 RepID=UPI0023D9989B|nr:hypothetical protein [Defluviimonas nitratireducens]MDF1620792.1 hypothetical protein [Defluviimonas nitratireducens]
MARTLKLFSRLGLFRPAEDAVLDARFAQISMAKSRKRARNRVSPFAQITRTA